MLGNRQLQLHFNSLSFVSVLNGMKETLNTMHMSLKGRIESKTDSDADRDMDAVSVFNTHWLSAFKDVVSHVWQQKLTVLLCRLLKPRGLESIIWENMFLLL